MTSTMKAYRFSKPSTGLYPEQVAVPTPLPGQILVRVKAAGLCHTDCNIISGKDDTFFWKRPITLGHEIAGEITAVGSDITKFSVGDRVVSVITTAFPPVLSDVINSPGIGLDGGFAEYVTMYEEKTLRIPDGVTFAQASVATDAIATAYRAVVNEGEVSKGTKVAIIGLGGLGLSAVQIAALRDAKIYGIELDTRKYARAAQMGAYSCAKSFEAFAGVKFDVIVDFAGTGTTTAAALKAVKDRGKVVLVGLASKSATIDTYDFIARGITLKASAGSSIEDVERCLQLIENKEIEPLIEDISFDQIVKGIDRLHRGDVVGRLWTDPSKM